MKPLLGLFLIAHGLMHASYFTPKPDDPRYPFDFTKGWFVAVAGQSARPVGMMLAIVTVVCFLVAGLGVLGVPGLAGLWKTSLTLGALASTLVLVLFWHTWLILGLVINAVLLFGVYRLGWSPAS